MYKTSQQNPRFEDRLSRYVGKPDERSGASPPSRPAPDDEQYNNMLMAYKAKNERKQQGSAMTTLEKGFIDKCAQLGINPRIMMKYAEGEQGFDWRTLGEQAKNYGSKALDWSKANPELAGAGAGALLGGGIGAVSGRRKNSARNAFIGALSGAGVGAGAGAGMDPRVQEYIQSMMAQHKPEQVNNGPALTTPPAK